MSDGDRRVLLVSTRRFSDTGGRAERFQTRAEQLRDRGWEVELGYVPEPYILGFPLAVYRLTKQARRTDVDVVNSVNNPFHLHAIGYLVALFAGVPWLVEFRDPMVTNPDLQGDSLKPLRKAMEWFAVNFSDKVVWGDGIQIEPDYYEETYAVPPEKITRLPFAGFNEDAFAEAAAEEYDAFTMTYAGSFYEGWLEPFDFLAGLRAYVERHDPEPGEFRVQFYGDWDERYGQSVRDHGLDAYVETHAFVPHDEIIPVLKGSDALVHITGTDRSNRQNVPQKVMDYIGARQPILVVAPASFRAAEAISDNGFGIVADPTDPDDIATTIERIRTGDFERDDSTVADFTRKHKNDELAAVLDDLVAEQKN